MGAYGGPEIAESGLVLALDAGNKKSYSQNEFQYSTDIFGWCSSSLLNNCAISRDTITSPVGNTPLKMVVTGTGIDPHIQTYNTAIWNVAPAATGQRWVVSVYARADVATTGQIFIFGANSAGTGFVSGAWLAITALTFNITTEWTRFSDYIDMNNASIAYIHTRLDGPDSGGTGISIWWDGLQVERVPSGTTTPTPFTSTYWGGSLYRDLSGINSSGELINFPTYNASNSGYFQFVTDDYIRIPNNTALDTQTPTVEVWVKTNATTQYGFWFEKGIVNSQYSLFQESGYIVWRHNIGGITNLVVNPTSSYMNTSNWYQVVGTYTSGSRRLYINGTLVGSDTQTGTIATDNGGMSIGVYGGYSGARGYYYDGNLSVCRIYNRALTDAEIQQNFNATKSRYGI